MLVRIQAAQQAQTGTPEAARSQQSQELRDQIRETIRAAREAAVDARNAQRDANRARMESGLPAIPPIPPVPAIPQIPGVQVRVGDPGPVIPPQAVDIAIGFFVMCAVMIIGWPLARAFGRRLERGGPAAAVSPVVAEQLQRIEHTVEAMAIEVERISESQRYLAKLHSAPHSEPAALDAGERR